MRNRTGHIRRWIPLTMLIAGSLLIAVGGGLTSVGQTDTAIVINEVELNPNGRDGQRGVEEWVELFNPSDRSIDVSDYRFETQAGYETLAEPISAFMATRDGQEVETATVSAQGYLVLHMENQQWLDNRNETLYLLNADGEPLDRMPELTDTDDDNQTWQRIPNGQDTNTEIDWRFRRSSKGATND